MTQIDAFGPVAPGNRIVKLTAFLFGAVAYLTFLFTILYAIGFVSGLVVQKDIDSGAKSPVLEALAINLAAGTWTCRVTDAHGCTSDPSVT